MKKIVVVFDIDNTLFNRFNEDENEWVGSRKLWLDLCFRLKNLALKYGVELNFAIATAKDGVDILVEEVAQTFHEYLFTIDMKTHLQMPVIHHSCLKVHHEDKPAIIDLCSDDYETSYDPESDIISSIHVAYRDKSPSLIKIAEMFGVDDYTNVFLVDDTRRMLNEARNVGFSVISAEGVCVRNKTTREDNARQLVKQIEITITEKMMMQPTCDSLFFTKPPELTPLQKMLGAEVVESKNSRRYMLS